MAQQRNTNKGGSDQAYLAKELWGGMGLWKGRVYGRDGIQGMTGVLGKWILGKNGAGKARPWLLVNKRAGRGNTHKSAHGPVV